MSSPAPLAAAAAVLMIFATAAPADEVRFKNGDRLTGKINSAEGGKLKLTTKAAGDLTIDLKEVETFSTDAPLAVHLKDRSVVRERIESGPPGTIQPAGGAGA